jgi:IMP dehydrogenase
MAKVIRKAYTFDDLTLVPKFSNIKSRTIPTTETWLTKKTKTKIPLIPANMDTVTGPELARVIIKNGGYPILHRFTSFNEQEKWVKEFSENCYISSGVGERDVNNAIKLLKLGARGVCIDIAHGHSLVMMNTIRRFKKELPEKEVIAGNICTSGGYVDLVTAGADAVKVGIGSGAACSTRIVTGFGVPQMTAILDCAEMAKCYSVPIIADGGIRNSRDVALALAAGASTCMIGSLFAKTVESCASKFMIKDNTYIKIDNEETMKRYLKKESLLVKYRGQASEDFQKDFKGGMKVGTVAEGIAFMAPLKGSCQDIIDELLGGLRSAFTYGGAKNIKEFQRKAEFMEVATESFSKESNPRKEGKVLG